MSYSAQKFRAWLKSTNGKIIIASLFIAALITGANLVQSSRTQGSLWDDLLMWFGASSSSDSAGDSGGGGDTGDTGSSSGGPTCGDGTIDMGEECDDGNTDDTDACSDTCAFKDNGCTSDGKGGCVPTAGSTCQICTLSARGCGCSSK